MLKEETNPLYDLYTAVIRSMNNNPEKWESTITNETGVCLKNKEAGVMVIVFKDTAKIVNYSLPDSDSSFYKDLHKTAILFISKEKEREIVAKNREIQDVIIKLR